MRRREAIRGWKPLHEHWKRASAALATATTDADVDRLSGWEQRAWDALIEWVDESGLNDSAFDPRVEAYYQTGGDPR